MQNFSKPFAVKNAVSYAEKSIVSKTIIKKTAGTVTLFAFDEGEELSPHTAPYDAFVQVLEGEAEITIADDAYTLLQGESILLPANVTHAVKAGKKFKMMLTMIKA